MKTDANIPSRLYPDSVDRPRVNPEAYQDLQPYIDSVVALSRLTYQSLYIIDYHRMNFLYVSDNPLFLCGKRVEEVQQEGYAFYYEHVPSEDIAFLTAVNRAGFEFFRRQPVEERSSYTISYNFQLYKEGTSELMLINHRLTPLKLDEEGNIWLALCIVSLASTSQRHTAYITQAYSKNCWQYTPSSGRWRLSETIELSEYEKAVIRLANQGLSVSEIAVKINKSEDSVKGYRKSLFVKLDVANISEAIAVATEHRLL